jgi:hypothetical protein
MDESQMGSRATRHAAAPGLTVWRVLSALALLAMGGIHLYLVLFSGFGGTLGLLFVLNAIGGLVLAVAVLVTRRGLFLLACVLGLLFLAGTLLGLVVALTPAGLIGIHESLDGELVVPTLVVESIGVVVLAVTSLLAARARR